MTRSVPCLLFPPVGRLVSYHSFIFSLMVHHINLLILLLLSLSEYTLFKNISRTIGGGGVIFNDINFDGEEQKICCNFVDELRGQGKSETLKKVEDINVYRTD